MYIQELETQMLILSLMMLQMLMGQMIYLALQMTVSVSLLQALVLGLETLP